MKKYIFYVLSSLVIFSSCTKNVKCNGIMEESALKNELVNYYAKQKTFFQVLGVDNPESLSNSLFNYNTKIDSVITLNFENEKKCDCQAFLKVKFNLKIKEDILSNLDSNSKELAQNYFNAMEKEISIKYILFKPEKNEYRVDLIKENEELLESIAYFIKIKEIENIIKLKKIKNIQPLLIE